MKNGFARGGCSTSQNRDLGHSILWLQFKMWTTRQFCNDSVLMFLFFSSQPGTPAEKLRQESLPMRTGRFLVILTACLITALRAEPQDVLTPVIASPLVPSTLAVLGTDG